MCVGNKADCIPSHFGHTEYRRRLQKRGESSSDPHPEFMEFGIDRSEGSGLLTEEDQEPEHRRRLCIEWCSERGIEYIEACAANEIFDQCKESSCGALASLKFLVFSATKSWTLRGCSSFNEHAGSIGIHKNHF